MPDHSHEQQIEAAKATVTEGIRGRQRMIIVIVVLGIITTINFAALAGVGILVANDRQDRRTEAAKTAKAQRDAATGYSILGDMYKKLNDIDARTAKQAGEPPPTPITVPVPPPTTTIPKRRGTTTTTTRRPTTTTTARPAPTTTSTSTSAPPQPTTTNPPPTTTTTAPTCVGPVCLKG